MTKSNDNKTSKNIQFDSYESFLAYNRVRINIYLNWALWVCALSGPAIAMGVYFHAFKDVSYKTCFTCSLIIVLLALIHLIFLRLKPQSIITSIYSFLALDILLVYMVNSHMYIRLTWFLVPLLSLVFCSYRIYYTSLFITYFTMLLSLYISAPFYSSQRVDMPSFMQYFINVTTGCTIEILVMGFAGIGILKTTHRYTKELFEKNKSLETREAMIQDSISTLKSMAGIYDRVNLLNFENMTEIPLQGGLSNEVLNISGFEHTHMVQEMKKYISPDHIPSFWEFTDLTTLRSRLMDNMSVYGEFINIMTGWFRVQYIVVERKADGVPAKIIFTVQDIDKDKRKENHLIKLANTDELTRLYNRRRYDEEIRSYRETGLDEGFTLLSADVNGLKTTNDTKGHAAGDELIIAAADCLHTAILPYGKVFRTGGDEFIAILHIQDYKDLCNEIMARARIWHGDYSDTLSISLGCASHNEFPDSTIDDLERISDSRMYEAKEQYYKQSGKDRRKK